MPLHFTELVEHHDHVQFCSPSNETLSGYSSFISDYFGYIRTNRKEKKDLPKLIEDYNIQTEEEYEAFLPLLSAKPDFRLTFIHTAEAFCHYEISIDGGDAIILYDNELNWSLVEGMNRITARTVNDCGVKGVPVSMTIYYGE